MYTRSSRLISAVLLVIAAIVPVTNAQSPEPVDINFPSAGYSVHGRFFRAAATDPMATVLLLPGWGFNPNDVLGLGQLLSALDVNVMTFTPRGTRQSEGIFSYENTLDDINAALHWLRTPEVHQRFRVDPERLALGGHSFGGGVAMAYAARDSMIRRIISIAGADHGEYARMVHRDTIYAAALRKRLSASRAPQGTVRYEGDDLLNEILGRENDYGHPENAPRLADRAILLLCAWDDTETLIETMVLPVYRALKRQSGSDVTIRVYEDNHSFGKSRERLASEIREWLVQHSPQPDAGTSDTLTLTEEQQVLAAEDEWINAEINRDEATLRRVIDDRFVYNSNDGILSDKAALIKNVLGWNMTGQTVTERTVMVEGTAAVVFGTTELRFASEGKEEKVSLLRYTTVYIKRQQQWRALALQMAKRLSR